LFSRLFLSLFLSSLPITPFIEYLCYSSYQTVFISLSVVIFFLPPLPLSSVERWNHPPIHLPCLSMYVHHQETTKARHINWWAKRVRGKWMDAMAPLRLFLLGHGCNIFMVFCSQQTNFCLFF
jgi:hypothetical protein